MSETSQTKTTGSDASTSGDGESTTTSQAVDLTKLEGEQLQKVLENPNLFKLPRIAEALDAQKQLKKVQEDQQKAKEQSLTEQKKFEELAENRAKEIESLNKRIQDNEVNSVLTTKLYEQKVVDLDGALKLVDKSQINIDENGNIIGVEQALESLKTGKPYLFNNSGTAQVGSANNPASDTSTQSTGRYKFKESQITPEFYQEHKKELDEAGRLGLIEQDGPPR